MDYRWQNPVTHTYECAGSSSIDNLEEISMHLTVHMIILIAALVFGILATMSIQSPPRLQWGWAAVTTLILALFFT